MNRNESRYFATAARMQAALITLLDKKDFEFITVKEVCDAAEVNRSTFYLHYDNTTDLLTETIEAVYKDFFARYSGLDYTADSEYNVNTAAVSEIYLITPQYLEPYLDFVRENRKLFRLMYDKAETFKAEGMYNVWFSKIFRPILARFGVPDDEQPLIMVFYIKGLIGLISEWIRTDCTMPNEELIKVIRRVIIDPNEKGDRPDS